jgi:hypothetical protein
VLLHMAIFEWHDGVTDDDVAGFASDIHAMAAALPEIQHYFCGPSQRIRPGIGDFAIVAFVDDEAALDRYLDHPLHEAAVKQWTSHMVRNRYSLQLDGTDWGIPLCGM